MDNENGNVGQKSRPTAREARKPFGSQTQKLAYPPRANFHRHWFSDTPGRIEDALRAGYTHVEDKEGKKVSRPVGVSVSGGVEMGYLMEIPEEWYKEDMALQQRAIDANDDAIRRGAVSGTPGVDGRYVPESRGIKIREGNR